MGIHYALVTITPQVNELFKLLHIPFTPICNASIEKLEPSEKLTWGSYYESRPITGVICTRQGVINSIDKRAGKYAIHSMKVGSSVTQTQA